MHLLHQSWEFSFIQNINIDVILHIEGKPVEASQQIKFLNNPLKFDWNSSETNMLTAFKLPLNWSKDLDARLTCPSTFWVVYWTFLELHLIFPLTSLIIVCCFISFLHKRSRKCKKRETLMLDQKGRFNDVVWIACPLTVISWFQTSVCPHDEMTNQISSCCSPCSPSILACFCWWRDFHTLGLHALTQGHWLSAVASKRCLRCCFRKTRHRQRICELLPSWEICFLIFSVDQGLLEAETSEAVVGDSL